MAALAPTICASTRLTTASTSLRLSLIHITKIYLDHGHEDNPNHEQGGDIPVEAIDNNLRQLGINALPEHFKKEALNANHMILSTEKLRLKFKKF